MPATPVTKAPQSQLSKMSTQGASWNPKEGVLDVDSSHALLKAIGYLKYAHNGPVLFRGQAKPYPTIIPTLFRTNKKNQPLLSSRGSVNKRHTAISQWLTDNQKAHPFFRGTPDDAREPLLQHYGVNTRWIDLVDNVWIALWFACHSIQFQNARPFNTMHYLRRQPVIENYGLNAERQYSYIYVFNAGVETAAGGVDGLWTTAKGARIIDLRRCAPSMYLRPHAQHGLLLTRKGIVEPDDTDFGDYVVGVIRIALEKALSWLGDGSLLSVHSLFPPSYYDQGYGLLLSKNLTFRPLLGGLAIVEP
ncbi:MAG: FRG domain-containing protein [Polyangiaceae bacterium]|nr:FRG domain-containing protein [Polyangiaceae bacterium]